MTIREYVYAVNSPSQQESHLRSFLKGLTWRLVATTTIIIIAKLTTGSTEIAFTIGGIEFFVKLLLYYLHERAWQLVPRGSIRKAIRAKPEEQPPTS